MLKIVAIGLLLLVMLALRQTGKRGARRQRETRDRVMQRLRRENGSSPPEHPL